MPLLLCSFIGCLALCPKLNFFSSLVMVGPSRLLYQLCPSWLSHASGGGWGWEELTELRLIKFENTQQIDSWIRGKFSHDVSLSILFWWRTGHLSHSWYSFINCWVILACYFTSLYPPFSSQSLHGASFCFIEGFLRAPRSLFGLSCGSVKADWQQTFLTVLLHTTTSYLSRSGSFLVCSQAHHAAWSVNFHSSLLMLHLRGMQEVGLIWQDQGLTPVIDRPFVVSSGPHPNATQQIPSCTVASLPEPLAGCFEWFSYTAFHGPSEIDFSFEGGVGGEMR